MLKLGWALGGNKTAIWIESGESRLKFDIVIPTPKGALYVMYMNQTEVVKNGEVSPKEAVVERIAKLQKGYTSATGWKLVIDNYDQQDLLCLPHEISNFHSNVDMYILPQGAFLKIYLLRHGWSVAKTHMTVLIYRWSGTYQKQRNCCTLALGIMSKQ
jgi:hypothetical protein